MIDRSCYRIISNIIDRTGGVRLWLGKHIRYGIERAGRPNWILLKHTLLSLFLSPSMRNMSWWREKKRLSPSNPPIYSRAASRHCDKTLNENHVTLFWSFKKLDRLTQSMIEATLNLAYGSLSDRSTGKRKWKVYSLCITRLMDNSINQGQIWLGLFVGLICPPHYPYLYIMLHFLGHFCFRAQDHGFTHQMKELRRRA